jgi:CheY-like chemotaxis protein
VKVIEGARILVADDDADLLDAVAHALEQSGARVTRAASGGQLIEAVGDDGPFDLVVTDISMPWMTGLQVMHAVRTAGLTTPVVVMTALQDERIGAQVEALGRCAVLLRKPFTGRQLLEAVIGALSCRPAAEHAREPG